MNKLYTYLLSFLFLIPTLSIGQIIVTDPSFPTEGNQVTITYDAALGTGGLKDYTGDVYAHTGVITDQSTSNSDWKYAPTWGDNNEKYKLTSLGDNKWSLSITPNILEYYGVTAGEKVQKLAFVFRSADTNIEGKGDGNTDIFVDLSEGGLNVEFARPAENSVFEKTASALITINSESSESLELFIDDVSMNSTTSTQLNFSYTPNAAGSHQLIAVASAGSEEVRDTVNILFREETPIETKPSGLVDGINYISNTSVSLQLYAPNKEYVFAIGDFNNWEFSNNYQMKKDGDYFWITLENLTEGKEYVFQYVIDGEIKIADPYADKLLDPWNDQYITDSTYPNLIPYPSDKTSEIASVFQTAQTAFTWSDSEFTAPAKDDLVIYELHVRDFTAAGDIKTVQDTLDYLERLGVNVIELMPFNEFEGNDSWGYNPSFYFAPDKAYGTKDDYKAFINECHNRGIAVYMDMVLNHTYGQSPFLRMYFDGEKPTADNPWYNVDHNFENTDAHWGYDINHAKQATKDLVDRINTYWMNEYHIDGFRFDFTKGFSNKVHSNDPDNSEYDPWGGNYDAERISILRRMATAIWNVKSDAIVIFEHLSENQEETELANHGILLWGNANHNYNEATMGFNENGKSDLSWTSWKERAWNAPNLISYMESHDEERLMYKNLTYGKSSGDYDVTELNTALSRIETAAAFFFTIPGPKMVWQFGELGYDVSIDENGRVGKKPILWEYQDVAERKKLFQIYSALIDLKKKEEAFKSDDFTLITNTALKRIEINHSDMDVRVIGNFDVVAGTITPNFSKTGDWYDYFSGETLTVSDKVMNISLDPGEYHIYTTKQLTTPNIISAPIASNISLSGIFSEDETLTASYDYSDVNDDLEGSSLYQWYRADATNGSNETAISGATSLSYTLGSNDRNKFIRFSVTPIAQSGDHLQGNKTYGPYSDEIAVSTGINDILNKELRLYPNPVHDILHLENLKQVEKIQLFNLSGKAILVLDSPNQSAELNCNGLTKGTYLLVFKLEDGSKLSKKIVKQ